MGTSAFSEGMFRFFRGRLVALPHSFPESIAFYDYVKWNMELPLSLPAGECRVLEYYLFDLPADETKT